MRLRGISAALLAFATLGVVADVAPATARPRIAVRPVLGDWEGTGSYGLRLSFEFVRRGRHVAVKDLALGLPSGCRSPGNPAWEAGEDAAVEYTAPGTILHGPLPPLGATQFEFVIPPSSNDPFPLILPGRFSSSRRGVLSIPSPDLKCANGGWPKTLRFALAAATRVPVEDGLWTGSVTSAPGGATGTVQIRVIDGGRIETDFKASYACAEGGGGSFEIGPLPGDGNLVLANGSISGIIGGETVWSGRFTAGGQLEGNFTPLACGSSTPYTFAAARTGA